MRWWRARKPDALQFMGLQRVDMSEQLNNNNPGQKLPGEENNKHAQCLRGQAWESASLVKYNVEGTMNTRKLKNLCIYPEHAAHSEWPETPLNFQLWLEFGLSESSEAKAEFNMAWLRTEGVLHLQILKRMFSHFFFFPLCFLSCLYSTC